MNTRIEQLADLAWTMVSDEERARGELYDADKQRERRDQVFAELIVKECVHTVENRGGMCGALASNWIKEHFGVE